MSLKSDSKARIFPVFSILGTAASSETRALDPANLIAAFTLVTLMRAFAKIDTSDIVDGEAV